MKSLPAVLLSSLSFTLALLPASALNFSYTSLVLPPALQAPAVQLLGVNDSGQMVGLSYGGSSPLQSFLVDNGNFTVLQNPAFAGTAALALNNAGTVVGRTGNGNLGDFYSSFGFSLSGGTYTIVPDPPGASSHSSPSAISDNGAYVGLNAHFPGSDDRAFLFDGSSFIPLNPPGSPPAEYVTGVNSSGQVSGFSFESFSGSGQHAFFGTPGNLSVYDVPFPALGTAGVGLNDLGDLLVQYTTADLAVHSGVLIGNILEEIAFPGARSTWVTDISNDRMVVGFYQMTETSPLVGFYGEVSDVPEQPVHLAFWLAAVVGLIVRQRRSFRAS